MGKHLHEMIVYSEEFSLINSPAFYDCVVHLICTDGKGDFLYNDRLFTLAESPDYIEDHLQPINILVTSPS